MPLMVWPPGVAAWRRRQCRGEVEAAGGKGLLADQGLEGDNDLARLNEQRDTAFDRGDDDGLRLGERVAADGHQPRDGPR